MELIWKLSDTDISKIRDFVKSCDAEEVRKVIDRNVKHIDIDIDRDSMLRTMLNCLLPRESGSLSISRLDQSFSKKPFLLTYKYLSGLSHREEAFREIFLESGITKYADRIPKYFASNFDYLERTGWDLETEIKNALGKALSKNEERKLADLVDRSFKGFGSKEARCFLFNLGVTKYEIPIDSKIINWLEKSGFPLKFTNAALQDILFYHFISDGIQKLCEVSEVYPCVLYTAVGSAPLEHRKGKAKS
ncbi:MAG: hypothetical protein U0T33_04280 [Bacteroidales bacterium]